MRLIAFAAVTFSIAGALVACGGSSGAHPKATLRPTLTTRVATATAVPSGKATPAPSSKVFSMQLLAIGYG